MVEPELVAHEVVLGRLRGIDVGDVATPPRARVRHAGTEHQSVERVADVVVVRDGFRIPADGVQRAPRPEFLGRWCGRRAEDAQLRTDAHRATHEARAAGQPCGWGEAQGAEQLDRVAGDPDLARDVRASEAELVGGPEDPLERDRGLQSHRPRCALGRAERAAVPELEAHGRRAAEHEVHQWRDRGGDAAGGAQLRDVGP